MSLRKAVLFLAAAAVGTLAAPAAPAQAAVYGTLTVNQLSGIKDSPVASSFRAANIPVNDTVSPIGGTVGAYYDFFKLGPLKLGVDARGTITTTKRGAQTQFNGGGARIYSGLGGIRAVFHTRFAPIRPYIQGSAGIARTDYGLTNTIVNNFQYEGFAGVDITLLPVMDFRLVEFGYGGINPMGTNGHNFPVKSVSSGLVFHLPF